MKLYRSITVKPFKCFSVFIDDQLTWEPQVEYLKAKLISSIVTIKRINQFIQKTGNEKVYNALFMSHLSYCIIWQLLGWYLKL